MDVRRNWKLTAGGTIVLLYEREAFWIRIMRREGGRYVYLVPKLPIDTISLLRFLVPGPQTFAVANFEITLEDDYRMQANVDGVIVGWGGRKGFEVEVKVLLQAVGIDTRMPTNQED